MSNNFKREDRIKDSSIVDLKEDFNFQYIDGNNYPNQYKRRKKNNHKSIHDNNAFYNKESNNNYKNKYLGMKRNLANNFEECSHSNSCIKFYRGEFNKNRAFKNKDNYMKYNNNYNTFGINENQNKIMSKQKKPLPIANFKDEILRKINQNRIVIISGNTGCGKSTQVPQYIYNSNNENSIIMTQPRRIAAVSIAKRLAEEMKEKIGKKVGFHVSMNPNFSSKTKILVETTGIFMEQLVHKNLDFTHIILDEVHERDIFVDLVLALIKLYFEQNKDSKLKLILMSATIAENSFADYLKEINGGEIPIIKIEESMHKVTDFNLEYIIKNIRNDTFISNKLKHDIDNVTQSCINQAKPDPVFMSELFPVVAAIIEKIENENLDNKNGVLIFVPGIGEIQELQNYLLKYFIHKNNLDFLILHSQISDSEQDKIFKNNGKRKIILATNIAESSITISNIDFVIDFCLVKQKKYEEDENSSVLELKWCSKANCQQRKGRTGRINNGYYFQLIRKKLYEALDDHPKPEILRTPLDNPILKLKIYDPEREPSDLLLRTISPPSEEAILRTIFKLEKMGALIKGNIINKNNYIKGENNTYYKSGVITKIGKIFAELPIDIKYSRLIMISFALGEIDLGITLAAILSQERSIFLSSDKCNRYNLYKAKDYYGFGKECDFISSYTAYKKWFFNYGYLFVNSEAKFDTQLKYVSKDKYLEIKKYTSEQILDFRTLTEVIKVENDLKKRLEKFKIYSTYFDTYKDPTKAMNFQDNDNVFLLKIILAGTFYNNIFIPEYEETRNIENDILNTKNSEKQKELRTIRFHEISQDKARKLVEIFEAISEPDKIIDDEYNEESETYKIEFDKVEPLKKILFITSTTIKKDKEIPILLFKNNRNKNKFDDDRNINFLDDEDENEDVTEIKIDRQPEYYYRLKYFDEYLKQDIIQNKDSINFIQVIPNLEKLKNCKLITDCFVGRVGKNNNFVKYTKYTSVLPKIQNFDKIMMLIFAPKYKMVGSENPKTGNYIKYLGFQSFEFTGLRDFSNNDMVNEAFSYERVNIIKFDYLMTNYHLKIVNEIRALINDIIKFKYISKNEEKQNEEISKEEFEELYVEYQNKAKKIINKIKFLLSIKKIRDISNENYQELFNYISDIKYRNKNSQYFQNKIIQLEEENSTYYSESRDFDENSLTVNNIYNINDNEEDENNDFQNRDENNQVYMGYINFINNLQKNVQNDDFLQLHDPLIIENEYHFTDKKILKELCTRNFKIHNLYFDLVKDLRRMEKLSYLKYGYLICGTCFTEICEVKNENLILTNKEIGEYKIESTWMNDNLKPIFNKYGEIEKGINYDVNQKEQFVEKLDNLNIEYNNLLCCNSGKHVIGYMRKGDKFIYFESKLGVLYPDLDYEIIENKDCFMNDFKDIKEKIDKIMKDKETPEFMNKIFCKLCNFYVKNDLTEFKAHLKSKDHQEKLKELRREFI